MAIEFVPIQDATNFMIQECISSVLDVLPDDSPVPARMWARVEAIREGDYPAACDLLLNKWKGVGWSGWFPMWSNPYGAWSSATYLAPSLRGRGLLPVLRCRQAHAAVQVQKDLEQEVEFVSSIDSTNIRSLRASLKYARASGWKNSWYLYDDKNNDRILVRMEWPSPPKIPHQCFLGQNLSLFEEIISEPDIEYTTEAIENHEDLDLVVNTFIKNKYNLS